MQTNDLNRLVGYKNNHDLSTLLISGGRSCGKQDLIGSKEQMLKLKTAINENLLNKVSIEVEKFQTLGKSRRWIRRYIKRKYNIIEY